ncbi:MAG: hypothetical protein ISQ32_03130 [Rickettsiales bacterium]|nr:hypothetical protein [Rickettsiales bacterium]
MKFFKTSALAAIMASLSFPALSTAYDGTSSLDVNFTVAQQLSLNFTDLTSNTMTFENLVDGDVIDATTTLQIVGSSTFGDGTTERVINCTIEGNIITNPTDLVASPVSVNIGSNAVISLQLSACTAGDMVLSVQSNAISNLTIGSTYTTGTLTLSASYDSTAVVTSYS